MDGDGPNKNDVLRESAAKYLRKCARVGAPLIYQLVTLRKMTGQRQSDIAKSMRVSPGAISLIEAGKRKGTVDTITRYAHAFGLRLILVPKETL